MINYKNINYKKAQNQKKTKIEFNFVKKTETYIKQTKQFYFSVQRSRCTVMQKLKISEILTLKEC